MASFDEELKADPEDVQKNKVLAIISYLGCLFFVPLIAAKDSQFARFHANQGLTLFLLWIVLWAIDMALVFSGIPMAGIITTVVRLCVLVLMILGIVNAAGGKMKPLPLIGGIKLLK